MVMMVMVVEASSVMVVVKTSSPAESPSAVVAPSNMTSTVRHILRLCRSRLALDDVEYC